MLILAHPGLLLLIPLQILLGWVLPPFREHRQGLQVPFMQRLVDLTGRSPVTGAAVSRTPAWQRAQILVCSMLLAFALARPQWIGEPIVEELPTRDLLLCVDLSGSMETRDFVSASGDSVDRLTAVKEVLDDFLARREGDRVGLVFFGSAAFLQVPFTQDLELCRTLLDEAQVRMAGPKTALGDSIGLAVKLFEDSDVERRVLIVLTDGNDTGSGVPPENAARIAADEGIRIYAVAVGDPSAAGEEALDEQALRSMAELTGGRYFHAADREGLAQIYDELDALETRVESSRSYRPRSELYWLPLALALLLNMGYHTLQAAFYFLSRRAPR